MTSNKDLNWGERILLETLWMLCRLFGMLPHFVQYYIIAPIIYLFIYRVFRYRIKVVDDNLRHAFADKSEAERKEIRRKFYVILSEIFVSSIAMSSPSIKGKIDDKDDNTTEAAELRELTRGKNWVSLMAHIGLWEHSNLWGEYSESYAIGAYHKLKNRVMDALFLRLRTKNHRYTITLERKQIARFCIKNRNGVDGKNFGIGLIADQNPTVYDDNRWVDFLGREATFYDGGEALALKLKLPVYFVYQKRIGRGKYRIAFEPIHDGVEEVEPFDITLRYIRILESKIRQTPEMWLWSHRRWKLKQKAKA